MMQHRYLGLVAALGIAAGIQGAAAQTIDYGKLQELFGEPVTTSVTGSPQRASDVPADMEIVTADDIRRSGATDIPGVLRHVAGVDVLQWTNGQADVAIRGYNQVFSPRLLVLIDGRQVYADFYGVTIWSALPVELGAIRQIEVVEGPNSALFGFNAVGGVINIITYNPLLDDVHTASLTVGTQGLVEGSAVSTFKVGDDAGFRIEVGGRSNDDFSTPLPAFERGVRRGDNRGDINLSGLFQVSDEVQFGVTASHTEADQTEVLAGYFPQYSRYGTNSIKGQLTADTSYGLIQGTAYSNWIEGRTYDDFRLDPSDVIRNQVSVVQLQDVVKVGADHTFRAAFEYRHNTIATSFIPGAHVFYDIVSGTGMWNWRVTDSLTMTSALRVDRLSLGRDGILAPGTPFTNADWNRRTITEPSFNFGLVWRADDENTFRFSASRGLQAPNLIDFGGLDYRVPSAAFGNIRVIGVPTLNPSIVTNYEVAWETPLPALGAHLEATAFHQETEDILANSGAVLSITPQDLLVASANIGRSRAEGITLALTGKFADHWRWGLSYTPEIITDSFTPGTFFALTNTDFQHTTPTNVVNINLGWAHGRWEVDGYLRYESSFYGVATSAKVGGFASLQRIDDYVSVDGRVAYQLSDWATLALSGQNLIQARQRQTSGPEVERRILGSVAIKF